MEEKVEKLYTLAGDENKYQYITLIITLLVWTNVNVLPISLAYLERPPQVNFTDPITNLTALDVKLNYTICDYGPSSYNITETYNYSWVIEYNISCDRVNTGLIGTTIFAGEIVGAILFKVFADKVGRKKTYTISTVLLFLTLIAFTFSKNITQIFVLEAIGGLLSTTTAYASYFLASEAVSSRKRGIFTSIVNTAFSICGVVYIILFKYLGSWRLIFYISSTSACLITIVHYFYVEESPRIWLNKLDFDNFLKSLKSVAKKNNRLDQFNDEIQNNSEYISILQEVKTYINSSKKNCGQNLLAENSLRDMEYDFDKNNTKEKLLDGNEKKKYNIFALVKFKSLRWKFLISCFLWFCVGGNYYGLSIYLKRLPGDIYVTGIIIYLFEAFAYFFAGYIVNLPLMGRRGTIKVFYIVAIIGFSLLSIFELSDFVTVSITFIARFAVAGIFNVFYTYALEIYPTPVRALGFSVNALFAKVGAVVFPLLIEIMEEYISVIFVGMNIVCFGLMLFMPETNGIALLENIKEVEENLKSESFSTNNEEKHLSKINIVK